MGTNAFTIDLQRSEPRCVQASTLNEVLLRHTCLLADMKEVSSQLCGSTIRHKKSFTDKLKHEIMRPIYRMRVRQYSASGK